jgi:hypothetical protein
MDVPDSSKGQRQSSGSLKSAGGFFILCVKMGIEAQRIHRGMGKLGFFICGVVLGF